MGFYHVFWGVPVFFPLKQSIEKWSCFRILPCAELVILLLDLTCSWRCRVHNSEAVETTKSFLQVLVQVALGTRQIWCARFMVVHGGKTSNQSEVTVL